jgi:hypothetical protein
VMRHALAGTDRTASWQMHAMTTSSVICGAVACAIRGATNRDGETPEAAGLAATR